MAKKPAPPGSSSIPPKKMAPLPPMQAISPKEMFEGAAANGPAHPATNSAPNPAAHAPQGPVSQQATQMDMPQPDQLRDIPPLRAAASKPNDPVRRIIGATIADAPPRMNDSPGSWPFWAGIGISAVWFLVVFFVVMNSSGKIAGMPITSVALGLSGVLAPVAFLWMVIAYLQRASDIKAVTEPLRRQLQMIVGTGTAAEGRVRRFNDALEKQLELLRQSGDGSYDVLQNAIQVLQEEEKAIQSLADRSGKEIQRIAGIVRDNSEVLEDLLHDNRERFNDLSGKIANNIATLDSRAVAASDSLGEVVTRLHTLVDQFKNVADEKLTKCSELSDKMGDQEIRTVEAAKRMHTMLEAARSGADELNRILAANQDMLDDSGARLVNRMQDITQKVSEFNDQSDAKEEKLADKSRSLSNTLAREIATLEALTNRLESQISAANEGLGTNSDELEARHSRITEQASNLMQYMQSTMGQLDQNTGTVFEKFSALREQVAEQSQRVMDQFNASSEGYNNVSDKLDGISRTVAERVSAIGSNLDNQVENIARSTERAAAATNQANAGVSNAMQQLEVMIGRIFDAELRAQESAGNVAGAYDRAIGSMQDKVNAIGMTADQHISKLTLTHDEFEGVATRLATQARETEGTWQSLVAAAEKQQDILKEQLRAGIQEAVGMLNESAVAIETARDDVHRHIESGIYKSQELVEQMGRIGEAAGQPFDDALARVRGSVEQGEGQLARFAEILQKNAAHVGEISEQLAAHGEKAGYKAAEALAGLDAVSARMEAIQHDSMQSTQDVLLRLDRLVAQLQSRMGDLSATASDEQKKLAESVKHLSFDINGLIHDSQTAEARVRLAASVLAEQASGVRGQLESQVSAVEAVTQRYHQFAEVSHSGFEEKMDSLTAHMKSANENLDGLGEKIGDRTAQIAIVQSQLQDGSRVLEATTQAALDRLSVFTHALVAAQTTSQETAQVVYGRLSDMEGQFKRQIAAVSEGSETMAQNMRQAVADLVEQSIGLAAASQQAETRVSTLAGATSELQSQAQIVRMAIETEASAMQNRMGQVLAQIESACVGLERNAVIAFDRTEGMAKRFDKVSDAAFSMLGEAAMQIGTIADQTVGRMDSVNKSMHEQLSIITFAGEHLGDVSTDIRKTLENNTDTLGRLAAEIGATGFYAAEQLSLQVKGLNVEAEGLLHRFDALGRGLAHQSLSVLDISEQLGNNVRELTEQLSFAEGEAQRTRQQIITETAEFKNEVSNSAQNIAAVGDALQQRGDFAIAMVHQMAQRFTEATQHLKTQFETQAERVKTVTGGAQGHLEKLGDVLSEQASKLEGTTAKLGTSGQAVGETLEKANFLLRNLSGQIDRMKGSAAEISDSFVEKLEGRIAGYEAELKGMTTQAGSSIDDLSEKAKAVSQLMQQDAKQVADQILVMLHDMQRDVSGNMSEAADTAGQAIAQLRADSSTLARQLKSDAEDALTAPAQQVVEFHRNFRATFMGMAESIVGHLQQVKENGAAIVSQIRDGASEGAEQATIVMNGLRTAAEAEVRSMTTNVEQTMRQMHHIAQRVHQEISMGGESAQKAALQSLQSLQGEMETEMRSLVVRAGGALADLQRDCETLTGKLGQATTGVHQSAQDFGRMSQAIAGEARDIVNHVTMASQEVNQTLSGTNALLQRSQNTLFDVAQKSGDALGLFNETVERQSASLHQLQTQFAETANHMSETDMRMNTLKTGFQTVLSDLIEQLNGGMLNLGQQILNVREETQGAVAEVGHGAEVLSQQKGLITTQAQALAQALSQLEQVNRTLSENMRSSVEDTSANVEKFERQTERVRQASETTGQWVTSLGQHMQNQLSQLSREMERTVTRMATPPRAEINMPSFAAPAMPAAPAPAPISAPAASTTTSSYAPKPMAKPFTTTATASDNDPLAKLREMAKANAEKPLTSSIKPAAPAAKPANTADSELINSLSQIIQQLEDTAGGKEMGEALRKKLGK